MFAGLFTYLLVLE